jgi:hypothetical protein
MKNAVFVFLSMSLASTWAVAQNAVVLINQATVAASGANRATGGFPYTITQPGSYQLSGNLTVPNATTSGIVIASNNVSLDLNGFSIIGPVVCPIAPAVCNTVAVPTVAGVLASELLSGTTVTTGMVSGMGGSGIILGSIGGSTVNKVQAIGNAGSGILLNNGAVTNSLANANGIGGIAIFNGSASGNTANYNGGDGITVSQGSVSGNTASGNGHYGFLVSCPSSIVNNTAFVNSVQNIVLNGAGCASANNAAP